MLKPRDIEAAAPAVERLAGSALYRDPMAEIPWHRLDRDQPWLPEHLISLHGTAEYSALTDMERLRLSQVEFVAMAELGLWLESLFLARFAREALALLEADPALYRDQLHELREEAGHSLMFLELKARSGAGALVMARRRLALAGFVMRHLPSQSPLFWIATYIGEAVPNHFNRLVLADASLPKAVRAVVAIHMRDENGHVAYARDQIARRLPHMGHAKRAILRPLLARVFRRFLRTCFYPEAAVYAAAGLANPARLAEAARTSAARQAVIEDCAQPVRTFLAEQGLRI